MAPAGSDPNRLAAAALLPLAIVVVIALLACGTFVTAETIDPNGDGSQYAWAENTGWINAEPGGDGGLGMSITTDGVEGWLWSENLGWISLSCENSSSCSSVDFRVLHDGIGGLSGYGWSENAGWVSFSCENTGSCATVDYSVFLDLGTGELSGYAWSENIGWIVLSCATTTSCASVDYRVVSTVPLPDPIFTDGFEFGDTRAWSVTHP